MCTAVSVCPPGLKCAHSGSELCTAGEVSEEMHWARLGVLGCFWRCAWSQSVHGGILGVCTGPRDTPKVLGVCTGVEGSGMPASVSVHEGSANVQAGVKGQSWFMRVPQGAGRARPTRKATCAGARGRWCPCGARLTRALLP